MRAGAPQGGGGSGVLSEERRPATVAFGGQGDQEKPCRGVGVGTWGETARSDHQRAGTHLLSLLPAVHSTAALAVRTGHRPPQGSVQSGFKALKPSPMGVRSHTWLDHVMTRAQGSCSGVGVPASWWCDQDTSFNSPVSVSVLGVWHITFNTCELLLKTWVILYLKILHSA